MITPGLSHANSGTYRAVFIDRDGTLTEEGGYINHPGRIRLLPRSAEAVRLLNEAGVKAVLATNQSGIARGYLDESTLEEIHREMVRQLAERGAHLDGIYYCPHHPTEGPEPYRRVCGCRKPDPGLLQRAQRDLKLDLTRSFIVGDKISDILLARRVGAKGVFVLTGYGLGQWEYQRHRWTETPDHVAEDLYAAVQWILLSIQEAREKPLLGRCG